MERLEIKSRVDTKLDEWKRTLDIMRAKVDASEDDATAKYQEQVVALEKQHHELKAKAADVWDSAEDKWDAAAQDVERALDEWEQRAASARDSLLK